MDKEDLKEQVKALVASMFDEKEETEIRRQTQEELEKSANAISDLTTALEDKTTECSSVNEELEVSKAHVQELESELEAAEKELKTANEKLTEVETSLENIKKDREAGQRMVDLEGAGVVSSDKEGQLGKVREMSDEEFASYKDELVSIREAVVAELEKTAADVKAQEEADERAKEIEKKDSMKDKDNKDKKGESSNEGSGTSEGAAYKEGIAPAHIAPGQAAMASLNMEFVPTNDVKAKYAELGKAMAAKFDSKKSQ